MIVHESPKPHGPDVIAGMLLTCMRKFPGVELRGRAYDHRSAYRQLPVHLESLKHSYVAHWNEQARAVEIDQLLALKVRGLSLCLRFPQGSYLSVVDWLHVFFVFPHLFPAAQSHQQRPPTVSDGKAPTPGPHRGPWRLPSTGSCQRTSARTLCNSGASPARLHSPASGSSSSDAAMARCAASASRPEHRATQAARAAARSGSGTSKARCPASKRSQVAASAPKRPPTSTPTTTKRQRRARTKSDGACVARLRRQLGQGARPLPAEPHQPWCRG